MLTAERLSKRYGKGTGYEAVADINFQLEKGRFIAIVGRSGSGKSTLLAMLGGISRPTSGNVLLDGTNQWLLNDDKHSDFRNRKVGFVFQFASLLPSLRAIDNVALPAIVGSVIDDGKAYARARSLLEHVGLGDRAEHYPGQLSGGEQRRVAIARALINSPEILLADEPTADLDEETEEEILNLLISIHRTFALTLVVVTHNPLIAERADQVLTMKGGKAIVSNCASDRRPLMTNEAPDQINQIFDQSARGADQVKLGEGIERLLGRFILWMIPMVLIGWAINAGISSYEQNQIDAKLERRLALEDLGMKGLRAEIKSITMGTGQSYNVDVYLRNVIPDQSLYVMPIGIRGFVQVGSSWQEVPMKAEQSLGNKVMKIEGTTILKYVLTPDVRGYAELLPYYMHVRISNDMLVSPSDQPKDDLIERSDSYYVYLKPHGAADNAILHKLHFPTAPPVWIPMPPH